MMWGAVGVWFFYYLLPWADDHPISKSPGKPVHSACVLRREGEGAWLRKGEGAWLRERSQAVS